MLKKFGCLFGLFFYIVGVAGGIGYCAYLKQYVIAASILLLGAMAFPTAKKFYETLVSVD